MSVMTKDEMKNFETADRDAQIFVEKNKWFVVVLFQMVMLVVLLFMYVSASSNASKPAETRYMLMYPDGSWNIEFNPPSNTQQYFKTTIDKLLSDYVSYRFGKIPQTIRSDYGKATLFMGAQQKSWFVGDTGFNAIEEAGTISSSKSPNTTKVTVLFFDHQDAVKGVFDGGANTKKIIRTNVYIEETTMDKYGNSVSDPVRKIINLTWTLLNKKELKNKEQKFFLVNPLGVTILSERETIDRGAYLNN